MLKIGKYHFEETWKNRMTSIMYFEADEDECAQWSVDIAFENGEYEGEEIAPNICINPIDTEKNSVEELVGEEFEAEDIETCEDREDTFYIYEHEPMCNFKVKLIEIDGDKAHVVGSGALIVDGYADPYKVDNFEFDSWVPIILSKEDWAKYEK